MGNSLFDRIKSTVQRLTPQMTSASMKHTLAPVKDEEVIPADAGQHEVVEKAPYAAYASVSAVLKKAGGKHVLVTFTYNGKERVCEPYSLRKGKSGILFYGFELADQHIKSYYLFNMQDAKPTDIPFVPKWTVEF